MSNKNLSRNGVLIVVRSYYLYSIKNDITYIYIYMSNQLGVVWGA